MLSSDLRTVYESYQNIYEEGDGISCEMIEEIVEELIEECLEFGHTIDEAANVVEAATIEYLDEAKVTYGSDTESPEQRRERAKTKVGEKRAEARKTAVKTAVGRVKAKAKGAVAAAGIAGSIAKDEARRAGRAAAHAVSSTVQKKKAEVKKGVKGLIGKGLRKAAGAVGKVAQKAAGAASRLGEEVEIHEAEGSYGQTPKAREAMGALANKRRATPASGFAKRGEKTTKVKSAEKHYNRMGNPDAGNRGKKSTKPSAWSGKRSGMTQKDRDEARGGDEYGHIGYDPDWHGGPSAPGGKPKGKKAERQKKTGVSAESFDYKNKVEIYDVVLEYLLETGHAETISEAQYIMSQMNSESIEAIVETRMDPRGRPASGPMNVYAKNKPNTDPKFQAALQAVRDADAKKTPEQRKAELDAYKERQANR
jgi:hypothetical protein